LIFGLVFVSRDFEVGTNKESTVSPRMRLILSLQYWWTHLFVVLKICFSESYDKVSHPFCYEVFLQSYDFMTL